MNKPRAGRVLGVPYDWRPLTWSPLKAGVWNPQEERLLLPKVYGWGYSLNLAEVAWWRRLREKATITRAMTEMLAHAAQCC